MPNLEDGLYNYIYSKRRIFSWVAIIFVVGVLGSVLKFYPEVFSDQTLSYYLFSTIVQGFLALVGFLGAVALFKLQNLESDANTTTNFVRPWVVEQIGIVANGYSSIQTMNKLGEILDKQNMVIVNSELQIAHNRLTEIFSEKSIVRRVMVDFSLWSFVDVLVALLGIPLSRLLIVYHLYLLIALYSIINISLSIGAIYAGFIMIRHILGYSFTARVKTGVFKLK